MNVIYLGIILSVLFSQSACTVLPFAHDSYSAVQAIQPIFDGDLIALPLVQYTLTDIRGGHGAPNSKNFKAQVAYYQVSLDKGPIKPNHTRRLTDGSARALSGRRGEFSHGDADAGFELKEFSAVRPTGLTAWSLNYHDSRLHGFFAGNQWSKVRAILREQSLSKEFYLWVPDQKVENIIAFRKNGEIVRIDLKEQTAHADPDLSRLYQRVRNEPWYADGQRYLITQKGKAWVVIPTSGSVELRKETLTIAGKPHRRGRVGILMHTNRDTSKAIPLKQNGLPLASITERDGAIELLYSNLAKDDMDAYGGEYLHGQGTVRLLITDEDGKMLFKTEIQDGPVGISGGGERKDPGILLQAGWDANHGRVWWWRSSPRTSPLTWHRRHPDTFYLGMWNYQNGTSHKLELVAPKF